MHQKTVRVIFSSTLILLVVLFGVRYAIPTKIITYGKKLLTPLQENNTLLHRAPAKTALKIKDVLINRLKQIEIPEKQIDHHFQLEDSTLEINAAVPNGRPMEWIVWFLSNTIGEAGYHVADCLYDNQKENCIITLSSTRKHLPKVKIRLSRSTSYFASSAKIAIIVSDFGFEANATTVDLLSFPEPLTISLVGAKRMATWTAQIAKEYRKEIIILLPMEPLTKPYTKYRASMVMLHYPVEQIHALIHDATESIPYFAGFSNLGGSRLLKDTRVMTTVFDECKKTRGYFLIDPVAHQSVAASLARNMLVPYATIDISIRSNLSKESLQDTLQHAAVVAQKTGSVILQCRATTEFNSALRAELAHFHHNGIRLVYLSELVTHPTDKQSE